jgi:hypothetical protein
MEVKSRFLAYAPFAIVRHFNRFVSLHQLQPSDAIASRAVASFRTWHSNMVPSLQRLAAVHLETVNRSDRFLFRRIVSTIL